MRKSAGRAYSAVYEKRGKWYIGYVREVPNAHTQGRTLREVKANLRDALDLVLRTRRQLAGMSRKPERVIKESIHLRTA